MQTLPTEVPDLLSDAIGTLRLDWKNLNLFQRGDRLQPLTVNYSKRQLASALGCSPKLVRDALKLSSLPVENRPEAGKVGRKRLLGRVRVHDRKVGIGQQFHRRSMRAHLFHRLARTLVAWLKREMRDHCWDHFFDDILTLPACREELRRGMPRHWSECDIDGDWDGIIEKTRPPDALLDCSDYLLEYWLVWFSKWYPRCMPIPAIRERAFLFARRILRKKTAKHPLWWSD